MTSFCKVSNLRENQLFVFHSNKTTVYKVLHIEVNHRLEITTRVVYEPLFNLKNNYAKEATTKATLNKDVVIIEVPGSETKTTYAIRAHKDGWKEANNVLYLSDITHRQALTIAYAYAILLGTEVRANKVPSALIGCHDLDNYTGNGIYCAPDNAVSFLKNI